MKDLFRRWLRGRDRAMDDDVDAARAWAEGQGWRFARARSAAGFAIETGALRVEWGPPQRSYIEPMELRVRAELGGLGDLQLMVLSRALAKVLEAEVFEQATEDNRTRVDDRTPEEMRWLVLYPKLPRADLGPLADHYTALSNHRHAGAAWLDAAFRERLLALAPRLAPGRPAVIAVHRGRLVLRLAVERPGVPELELATALARAGASSALAVAADLNAGRLDSSQASVWDATALPPQSPP
ncbi:MAG TPA: hypothetical protein VFQ16_15670 [Burkholderiaceae bacterium]|nr:hypothetical protein [Burkholderiaceae bacterium]